MNAINLAIKPLNPEESVGQLSPAALELIDHITEILAAEYVAAIKDQKDQEDQK